MKLRNLIRYTYQGKLWNKIREKYSDYADARRETRWKLSAGRGAFFRERLQNGIRIDLPPKEKLSELIFRGNFEVEERHFIDAYLQPGDIFVDIGANVGLFTLIAAKAVRRKGKVYAFEPAPNTFEILVHNIELNRFKNVISLPVALSDRIETRFLTTSTDGYGAWNSFGSPSAGSAFEKVKVSCTTWDAFASEHNLVGNVSLMKIDIEGWEVYALNGAVQTLSRSDAPELIVEFTDENAKSAGTSCKALYQALSALGYQMHEIDLEHGSLCPDALRDHYPYSNLLATKRIDFVRRRLGIST